MKKGWMKLCCMSALLAFVMSGCGNTTETAAGETSMITVAEDEALEMEDSEPQAAEEEDIHKEIPDVRSENMQIGQIVSVDGNQITVALAETPEREQAPSGGEQPEMGEKPEGKQPEMGEKPEGKQPEMGEKPDEDIPEDGKNAPGRGGMPGGTLQFGDETVEITLGDAVEITSMNGEVYNVEDLVVDMVISFTTDDNEKAVTVQVMEMEYVPGGADSETAEENAGEE